MLKVTSIVSTILLSLTIAGCGDVTVNQPARPTVVIEEKKSAPVIIEKKTVVEKPVIIEKTTVEKPVIVIEKH